jgi:ATP-dependent helicase/nuclease subunit A
MTDLEEVLDRTRRLQAKAANPDACAWVSANAGTGKTHVLSRRVLRLLLAGAAPERILCLTYTKAAAAEMANRVFDELARWVTLSDEDLTKTLTELLEAKPQLPELARARALFACAIEAPGGLQVQTIHAFCERLLQRFPLEAGVPPGFTILDETEDRALERAAIDAVLHAATSDRESALGEALRLVIAYEMDDRFDAVLCEALRERRWIDWCLRLDTGQGDPLAAAEAFYRAALGVRPQLTRTHIEKELGAVLDDDTLRTLQTALARGLATDRQRADNLAAVLAAPTLAARIGALQTFFCTTAGQPRAQLMTQAIRAANGGLAAAASQAQGRFVALLDERAAFACVAATLALLRLADAALQHFAEAKRRRAALDFDDLIDRAVSLLRSRDSTQWVLYKLDGGLDHILVDESQDTSPRQWHLVEALAQEIVAAEGGRTLFAVGDEKQSIYGFQGAAPEMFGRVGAHFREAVRNAGRLWHDVPLTLSFRSAEPILEAVDLVFADPTRTPGVSAPTAHEARRIGQAGLVEIWPTEPHNAPAPGDPWSPLAEAASRPPAVRLAERIATTIRGWLDRGEFLDSEARAVRAGDIIVLVRKRGTFAGAMVAALKRRGIPVAGADRMTLTEQIAVADLMALGDFLTLPEDDLALAAVLKSPMFGLDDDALLRIAAGRRGTLWSALLRAANANGSPFREAGRTLARWRKRADFTPPYEFFAGILDRDGMRRRMLARLGPDAADPLDEFLELALTYDDRAPPSLSGFLGWLRRAKLEVKRDMEHGHNEVRVMTVHGAKGLEAPIVFLPDTCSTSGAKNALLQLADGPLPVGCEPPFVWPVKGSNRVTAVARARNEQADQERRERDRLLYVAMTRARDRLYVAGFAGRDGPQRDCWYDLIWAGLQGRVTEAVGVGGGKVWRLFAPQAETPDQCTKPDLVGRNAATALPDWASRPAPRDRDEGPAVTPSRLAPLEAPGDPPRRGTRTRSSAEPDVAASPEDVRFLRGTLTHLLLQHLPGLPEPEWPAAAKALLVARGDQLAIEVRDSIAAETLAVLTHRGFAPLFGPESRAEVPIVAAIPGAGGRVLRITGQVDRLAALEREILIIDYKTNRPAPRAIADVPDAYVVQLAAYRLALQHAYPAHAVRAALLWTDGCRIMEIPAALLDRTVPGLWERAPTSP